MRKYIYLLLGFSVLILSIPFAYRWTVREFRVGKLMFDSGASSQHAPIYDVPSAIQIVLKQPFVYLSHGAQSFVFASEDGKYILKLLRRSVRPHPWRSGLRNWAFYWQKRLNPKKRDERLLRACALAYERAQDLTGLAALHLTYTESDLKIGQWQGGAPNLSQAKPTPGPQKNAAFFWGRPLQLNLHSPSDAGGLKGGGCPTQPEPIFESRAVYTDTILPQALLKDSIGRTHQVDLNRCCFVLQHRARSIRDVFTEAAKDGDRERFSHLIRQFIALLKNRTDRNLANSDTKVGSNFGFLENQAIEWDFGNYWIDERLQDLDCRSREIGIFVKHLQFYLRRITPDWAGDVRAIFEEEMYP